MKKLPQNGKKNRVFLSETLYVELPKNLVICFNGTSAALLLDTTKTPHIFLPLLNLKQRISTWLLILQITEYHLKLPKTICQHPQLSTTIQNHPPKNICNHPKPTNTTRNHPQSARIYLELAVTALKSSISMWEHPQSFIKKYLRETLVFTWNSVKV